MDDTWELAGEEEERRQRERKKRNEAFKRRLKQERVGRVAHARLKMVAMATAFIWIYVGWQVWR